VVRRRLGWRLSGAVATVARLAIMCEPVRRLRRRWTKAAI